MPNPLLVLALAMPVPQSDPRGAVDFGRDVRPILSQNCYACHGPDDDAREARLRLDRADPAHAAREILVAGDPAASELYRRITAEDRDERMPPREAKRVLTAAQIDVLRRWIEQGASFDEHWAFRAIGRPDVPIVPRGAAADEPSAVNEIDAFVRARLAEHGIAPSPRADRRTLIRRATLDLTGMPPTLLEVRQFLEDARPDAYERLVDRLLSSKAHAERMTLAWMDAARYGDTSVYHADGPRDMWPWRDWVIDAYYTNMRFDDFTVAQLAGDLLPGATRADRIASGFNRNNGTSDEGGAIDEELRVGYIVDRVKTTSNVWLGLSMECAQCHEHKFDPIEHDDYYRFFAYFNQSVEKGFQTRNGNEAPIERVPSPEQERQERRIAAEIGAAEAALAAAEAPESELRAWADAQRAELLALEDPRLGTWHAVGPFERKSQRDAFQLEAGPETVAAIDVGAPVGERHWQEHLDWPDGKVHSLGLPNNSAIYLHRTITFERPTRRTVSLGSDDTIQVWLNGEPVLAKEVGRGAQPDQDRVDLDLRAGENHFLLKVCNGGGASGFYFRLLGVALPDAVVAALRVGDRDRSIEQRTAIAEHYRREVWPPGVAQVARLDAANEELEDLRKRIPTVMIAGDRPGGRMTYVLNRGQYDAPLEDRPVEPGVPEFLLPMPEDAPKNRLGLARWLVDEDHPLTARVAVNRYWAMLFGRGIVETVMDFGAQGAWPSHPKLLDWLARDFIDHGFDVRRTIKKIVMSATYRQSSNARPELAQVDPENRLLASAPRYRLQGEFIRDQALAASGLLVDLVGGPSVKPYQPPGLWNEVSLDGNLRFQQDHGEKLYRKSMYIYWKRSAPMPAMTTFDAPTREKCVVQRQRTNTPMQALVTLNDVQFVEAARHLAERMLRGGRTFDERLDVGFELCTTRPADDLRRRVMSSALDAELAAFAAAPARADALLASGESPREASLDPIEHAAWTVLASMLLNLDETLNRD